MSFLRAVMIGASEAGETEVWDVLSNEEAWLRVVKKSTNEAGAANAVSEAPANAWRQKYPTAKVDDISVVYMVMRYINQMPIEITLDMIKNYKRKQNQHGIIKKELQKT
ncbi:hypothetical protein YC2023_000549 [Brassica napus]